MNINQAKARPGPPKWWLIVGITLIAACFRLYQIASLPPGDGYDPAFYGIDALEILEGARPVFFTTNFGREALFSYLVAICFAALGPGTLAIHIAAAIAGILTVPAVYVMADEMFSTEEGILARFGGPLAALTVAISYWHLNWSRCGVRAVLVPLFVALTLYFLWHTIILTKAPCRWRTLRTSPEVTSRLTAIACGLFLGLSLYTYQAARFLPLLVPPAFLYAARARERPPGQTFIQAFIKQDLGNLALIVGVALLVFAPLGQHFLTHPGSFSARVEQASVLDPSQGLGSNLRTLMERLVDTLLLFSIRGDNEPFSNIPGRPLLNPFLSLALCAGIGISLLRIKIKRPLYPFLLTWLGVMMTPANLSQFGAAAKRAIGALPAVAMLIATGALEAYRALHRWIVRRSPSPVLRIIPVAILVAGFTYTGIVTYRDYFVTWGQDPNLFKHFEVGVSAIGEYIGGLPSEEAVYLSPVLPDHASLRLHSGLREDVKGYNGRVCLIAPTQTTQETTYVIVPSEDKNSLDLLHTIFPQGGVTDEGPSYYGSPYFVAYRVPAGAEARLAPSSQKQINWDDRIELLGYDLDATTHAAGEPLHLTLYSRGLSAMDANYTVFVHLLGPQDPDTGGSLWGQDDSEPCRRFYPTSSWDVGEIVIDQFTVPIPVDAPTGDYELAMGFYQWPTLERLPLQDADGPGSSDGVATLGRVHITGPE